MRNPSDAHRNFPHAVLNRPPESRPLKPSSVLSNIFFIIGCWRSGTTALAQLLQMAGNAKVFVEAEPKLAFESRELREGRLLDPLGTFMDARQGLIAETHGKGLKYGEKNATLLEFVTSLASNGDCRFVLAVRDGRDVVRSLLDWRRFRPVIYGQKEDGASLVDSRESNDPWAYYMPRPQAGEAWAAEWKHLSFFEKSAWYWDNFNRRLLDAAEKIRPETYRFVDMSRANVETVRGVFDFLELKGFDPARAEAILDSRVNSLYARTGEQDSFPRWPQWTDEQRATFETFAGETMKRLGYL